MAWFRKRRRQLTLKEFQRQIDLAYLAGRGRSVYYPHGGGLHPNLPSSQDWAEARRYSDIVVRKHEEFFPIKDIKKQQ